MRLNIEKLASDGKGIARTNKGIVFVEGALPDEIVEADIILQKREYAVGKIIEVIESNPRRVLSKCEYFGMCGGCQLQHAAYDLQLEIKAGYVKEAFTRIGKINDFNEITCASSPLEWNYRNKGSFPVKLISGAISAGFYEMGSHNLVRIKNCPILHSSINSLYEKIIDALPYTAMTAYDETKHSGALRHVVIRTNGNDNIVVFVLNGSLSGLQRVKLGELAKELPASVTLNFNSKRGNSIFGDKTEVFSGKGMITVDSDNIKLTYGSTSFFQVNTKQSEIMYRYVCSLLPKGAKVLELYSGIGSLTLCVAKIVSSVLAIEEWGDSVKNMKQNFSANNVKNAKAICGKVEDVLPHLNKTEDIFDVVLLDPPRSGCDESIITNIIGHKHIIPQLIYVSCNPATLARDVRRFVDGGYTLQSIQAFDMFPQTTHVETVCLLSKLNAK